MFCLDPSFEFKRKSIIHSSARISCQSEFDLIDQLDHRSSIRKKKDIESCSIDMAEDHRSCKDKAFEWISKSSIAFIARLIDVQRTFSSTSIPPTDHYRLKFDRQHLRTLRGRVYEKMIEFDYTQLGEGILPASSDFHDGMKKVFVSTPTIDHLYVVCLNGSRKTIDQLIEINENEIEEINRCSRKT